MNLLFFGFVFSICFPLSSSSLVPEHRHYNEVGSHFLCLFLLIFLCLLIFPLANLSTSIVPTLLSITTTCKFTSSAIPYFQQSAAYLHLNISNPKFLKLKSCLFSPDHLPFLPFIHSILHISITIKCQGFEVEYMDVI